MRSTTVTRSLRTASNASGAVRPPVQCERLEGRRCAVDHVPLRLAALHDQAGVGEGNQRTQFLHGRGGDGVGLEAGAGPGGDPVEKLRLAGAQLRVAIETGIRDRHRRHPAHRLHGGDVVVTEVAATRRVEELHHADHALLDQERHDQAAAVSGAARLPGRRGVGQPALAPGRADHGARLYGEA